MKPHHIARQIGVSLLSLWIFGFASLMTWTIHPISYQVWDIQTIATNLYWLSVPIFCAIIISLRRIVKYMFDKYVIIFFKYHCFIGIIILTTIIYNIDLNAIYILLIIILIDIPTIIFFYGKSHQIFYLCDSRCVILVALIVAPASLLIWSAVNFLFVARSASIIADNRPYCLQVPGGYLGRYVEITKRAQLFGLRMQTPVTNGGGSTDYQFAFHAVLIVESGKEISMYNWSHRSQKFMPITGTMLNYTAKACAPRENFVSQLR